MKLGYIDYLNCYPFYYHMFERTAVKGVRVVPGYPSDLNRMLADGDLDISPISSATYAVLADQARILPEFCLSSVGYVSSVILASKTEIGNLGGKKIGVTSASHTSAVLLKVLLKKYYKAEPEYVPVAPFPTLEKTEAALLIGNEAMKFKNDPGIRIYDLGKLWMETTGFPVVFAVFAVRESAGAEYPVKTNEIVASYKRSLACIDDPSGDLVAKAGEKYPGVTHDIRGYYNLLKFEFTDELKKALLFYYQVAGELGLIPRLKELRYLY